MSAQLKLRGYQVGRRKAGRYMREMDITPIYPKMNLSKRMKQAKKTIYGIALVAGFILMASESATFVPNIVGVVVFTYSAYKLDLITALK